SNGLEGPFPCGARRMTVALARPIEQFAIAQRANIDEDEFRNVRRVSMNPPYAARNCSACHCRRIDQDGILNLGPGVYVRSWLLTYFAPRAERRSGGPSEIEQRLGADDDRQESDQVFPCCGHCADHAVGAGRSHRTQPWRSSAPRRTRLQ